MIVLSSPWIHRISRGFARAIALYPFILVRDASLKEDMVLIQHERIHFEATDRVACHPILCVVFAGVPHSTS